MVAGRSIPATRPHNRLFQCVSSDGPRRGQAKPAAPPASAGGVGAVQPICKNVPYSCPVPLPAAANASPHASRGDRPAGGLCGGRGPTGVGGLSRGPPPASPPRGEALGWGPLGGLATLPAILKPICLATVDHGVQDRTISPPTGAGRWRGRCAGFRKLRPPGSAAGCSPVVRPAGGARAARTLRTPDPGAMTRGPSGRAKGRGKGFRDGEDGFQVIVSVLEAGGRDPRGRGGGRGGGCARS
jgi:hypothetical protein